MGHQRILTPHRVLGLLWDFGFSSLSPWYLILKYHLEKQSHGNSATLLHIQQSKNYFEHCFNSQHLEWKEMSLLFCKVSLNSYTHSIFLIALFLNKKLCLHILIHHCVPLQTVTQNFYECNVTQNLWKK